MTTTIVGSIRNEFLRYRALAEGAITQVADADLTRATSETGNSIAVICQHVSGNLKSRFTHFLTSDGEKPWRNRDAEFEPRVLDRQELLDVWADGWQVLLGALDGLTDLDLERIVTIRQQPLSVIEALHRALAHVSYHAGQIVYAARDFRGAEWTSLSIPRGQSAAYNAAPDRDRGERLAGSVAASSGAPATKQAAAFKPAGYTSVAPYLIVDDAGRTIAFLQEAFDATELRRFPSPAGTVIHAEVRIGDTVVMLADGAPGWPPVAAHVHVYVADVDTTFQRALAAGATAVQEPARKDDDDKRGGVRDQGGTTWWIATRVV